MSEPEPTLRLVTKQEPVQPGDLQGGMLTSRMQFVRMIGSGGMGEVWEVRNGDLPGQRFAVKVVASEHARDPSVVARFFGEARAAGAINDPNIVSIHGTGRTEDGRPALIMEFIEGQSLAGLCDDCGRLPVDLAAKILIQIASAMRAAHRCNIVHRDIKPGNVMLTNRWGIECCVILVDFGIVKFRDAALAREIQTNTNQYLGTVGYSAVEQLLGRQVDAKADMYSLGVLAYRILCGHEPYVAENAMEVMNLQLNDAHFDEPRKLRPDMPHVWNELFMLCLQRDPARRPNASEFARWVAAGCKNGASLLTSLAPQIAAETRGSARDATVSSDIPTALAQIQARTRHRRSRFATAATLLAGVCVGGISVGTATTLVSRSQNDAAPAETRPIANNGNVLQDAAGHEPAARPDVRAAAPPAPAPDATATARKPLDNAAAAPSAALAVPDGDTPAAAKPTEPPPSPRREPDPPSPQARTGTKATSAPPARSPGGKGSLALDAKTWADCYLVDGGGEVFLGTAPNTIELPVGAHRVRCKNDSQHRDETVTVMVSATKQALVKNNW